MKKYFLLAFLFGVSAQAAEFQSLQNVMSGSCKDYKGLVSQYVAAGSLDENLTTAGERQYRNFIQQGKDLIDSCRDGKCEGENAEAQCKSEFYAASVTEISTYWVDFAQRQNCGTEIMGDMNTPSVEQLETAFQMENKPAECNDQHWNAIVSNLSFIKSLDKTLEDYASENGMTLSQSSSEDNQTVTEDEVLPVDDDNAGDENAVNRPPDIPVPGSEGSGNEETPPIAADPPTEADPGCVNCAAETAPPVPPTQTEDIEAVNAEVQKSFEDGLRGSKKDCCKTIEAMWKRQGKLTKGSALTAEGCKEAMEDNPKGFENFRRCLKQGVAGVFNSLKDSITSLFDLGTWSALGELAVMVGTLDGESLMAMMNQVIKSQTTDMHDYYQCLKPGFASIEKCERFMYIVAGVVGTGKFVAWFKPLKALKASGMLGKKAKAAAATAKAAKAAKIVARNKAFELAKKWGAREPGVTWKEVNAAANAAGMRVRQLSPGKLQLIEVAAKAKVTTPAAKAGSRALAAASAKSKEVFLGSRLVQLSKATGQKLDRFIRRGEVSQLRREIDAVPSSQRLSKAADAMQVTDSKQAALVKAMAAAKAKGDKTAIAQLNKEAKNIGEAKNYLSAKMGVEAKNSLKGLQGVEKQRALSKYLAGIAEKENKLALQIQNAMKRNDVFTVELLKKEQGRIDMIKKTIQGQSSMAEKIIKAVPPLPAVQCVDGNCTDSP